MKKYTIEIDEEVYRFLQSKAEVFVDKDANAVLRRLLLERNADFSSHTNAVIEFPELPKVIPDALIQLLEVIYLVNKGEERVNAVKIVAKRHHIQSTTVADKYIRGLHKNANQFDRMLEGKEYSELKRVLKERFKAHGDEIEDFFKKTHVSKLG